MIDLTESNLKEIYDKIPDKDKVTYQSWLRKLNRFADGNTRTTKRVQRSFGISSTTRKQYYSQDFISYDGEGYGDKFVLLANSLGERIVNTNGLSTEECLEFLTKQYESTKKRIWFSFSYDVNHILRDLPDESLLELLAGRTVTYKKYHLHYIPGKIFSVNNYHHYDVFSFFATSFINVVGLMLGKERVSKQLVEGKLGRGSFEHWNLDDLIAYNDEELALLVEIMNKLRDALLGVNVKLTEWYGPGAIAKHWFKKHNVKIPPIPASIPLYRALQASYFGGRFEQIKLGTFKGVYEYDIRSAYPSVMSEMPAFSDWRNVKVYNPNAEYSIWHVTFDLRSYLSKGFRGALPLPVRSKDGHICFPAMGKGWYWQHELKLVREFFPKGKVIVHEGYVAKGTDKPFTWIRSLYDYRLKLKSENNLSHYAIKVGLNSLYGKTAQTVGSNIYHSLAWAGYITSKTRVQIARAGYSTDPDNVIGFATDALFTTKRLDLPLSSDLGDWEEQYFDKGTFFQSGVYRLQTGEKIQDRYRGAPLRKGIDDIVAQLKSNSTRYPEIKIARFISHLLALRAPEAYGKFRLQFINIKHKLQIDTPYKRHYLGFIKTFDFDNGTIVFDFSKLLKEPISSLPKIWVGDVNFFRWTDNLTATLEDSEIMSLPAKVKDGVLQKLIDDGNIAAVDSAYIDVESVSSLPVVEDLNEG